MSKLFKVVDVTNKTVQMVPAESRQALEKDLLARHYEVCIPSKADLIAALTPKSSETAV